MFFSAKAQDLAPFALSWKDMYKALLTSLRTMYKLPVANAVQKAISSGFIADDPKSIAKFLLQGQNFKINKSELGVYLARYTGSIPSAPNIF